MWSPMARRAASILAAWLAQAALPQSGADILLYGCRTGAGDAGRRFVAAMAKGVGGRVAASGRPLELL